MTDEFRHTVLTLKKGQILLIQFDLSNVDREHAGKLMESYREEIYKVAEKAGIPREKLPLLLMGGAITVQTLDAVELLGLVGKTAD